MSVLDQADALMRRRSFVAAVETGTIEADVNSDVVDQSTIEDVPVLTDVVGDDLVTPYSPPSGGETAGTESLTGSALELEKALRERLNQLLMDRQAVLAQEIEAWLDEQMPQLVIRAMDGITDHLVSLLANRAKDELLPRLEAALKPLDPPEASANSAG